MLRYCQNTAAQRRYITKYRGAAPIHYAILNGETESGVTIMQMDIGMDTGDMLEKVSVAITPEMTQGELHDELKEKGGTLLLETIEKIKRGEAVPVKQNNDEATYAHLLTITKSAPLTLRRVLLQPCRTAKSLKSGGRSLRMAAARRAKCWKLPRQALK